ncbi:MAG TPA: alpha/beta hydrolase [Nocardioidaceae bacterium]|nr:alpha/beta hydrolase [Nocardioidaceae bacterium]
MNPTAQQTVISSDGTPIGFEVSGSGPVLITVHGGTADRSRWNTVAPLLARHFTVWAVDRRGRGLSGDATTYSLEAEAEDIRTLVREAGPGSVLLAHSYGATCAMAAASELHDLAALVLYEPAFETPGHVIVDEETFREVESLLAADDRDQALTLFFRRIIGLPDEMIDAMRPTPIWAARLAAAHTMPREGRSAQGFQVDAEKLRGLGYPVLVLRGTESPAWLRSAAAAASEAIPGSSLVELEGQAHMAMDTAPDSFVREVVSFLRRSEVPLS